MACLVQNTSSVDSSSGSGWSPLYGGGAHLDQEAIQYIHKFYCKDCRMEAEKAKAEAAASGDSPQNPGGSAEAGQPISPQSTLEEMSLQQSMDKNKESLKRKLLMRRSVNELVEQGIYPPLKTPPAYAEQRKHLERAKTGDLLRHKITHRPDRQQLVQQHILEDTKIDPSLHERQRLLKRARLADDLNEKISHRPGPLDLIRGNILKTEDDTLMEAIQEESPVPRSHCDGTVFSSSPESKDRQFHFVFDDDSNTSEGASSPLQGDESGLSDIGSPPIVPPPPAELPLTLQAKRPPQASGLSKLSPITTQSFTVVSNASVNSGGSGSSSKNGNSSNGINRSRPKKTKPKTQSKSKVIKFHEYKGPPNANKVQSSSSTASAPNATTNNNNNNNNNNPASETPYHILLQQQQLFLQWQLEFQQKNLNVPVLLPAQKLEQTVSSQSVTGSVVVTPTVTTSPTTVNSQAAVPAQVVVPAPVATQMVTQQAPVLQGQTQPVTQTTTVIKQPLQTQVKSPVLAGQQALAKPVRTQVQIAQPPVQQNKLQGIGKSVSTTNMTKPLSNLEEMKVADLKAELKKRNLPVSGPKPQLIERLKPYSDVIIGVAAPGSVNTSANSDTSLSPSMATLSKVPVRAVVSVKQIPAVSNDETMTSQSPPTSPKLSEQITSPLSPEGMDISSSANAVTLSANLKNSLSSSQNSIPMAVDTSRPPSVAPIEMAMEVDSSLDQSGNFTQTNFSAAQPATTTISLVTAPQSQVKQLTIQAPSSTTPLNNEVLLQQQQLKIAQLQKQLEESQMRLKLQQMHHQQLQHQQQQLHQLQQQTHIIQQPTSPQQTLPLLQQPNSPPQLQQQIIQPSSSPQPPQQPTPPPQILQQSSPLSQQPTSPPQLLQQPISPPQLLQQPISPTQFLHQPLSPPQTLTTNHTVTSSDGKISPIPNSVAAVTKLVQIPAQSLQSVIGNPGVALTTTQGLQITPQGLQTVMVTTNGATDKIIGAKPNLSDFFKTQAIHPSLNIVKPGTSASTAPVTFKQPTFIVSSSASGAKTITLTAPLNGIAQNRTTSLPSSPVENKISVTRTASNPFFVPLKEPPKYDEAVRSKQQMQQGSGILPQDSNNTSKPVIKSQAMDDVLEILIRSGELPPSAAQEPPPTPKTTNQTATIPTVSMAQVSITTTTANSYISASSPLQFPITTMSFSSPVTSPSPADEVTNLLNSTPLDCSTGISVKQESVSPPTVIGTPDLLDINDYMLNQDLNSMDWTSDQAFNLDLNDTSVMQTDQHSKSAHNQKDLLSIPTSSMDSGSGKSAPHGSEPDLAGLGLNDPDSSSNVQMDVSDWLDVIMPSTGLTPLSANPPVSFPSDPILTPKTQQEVLELFNFEDADFNTPTDLQSGINWEKLTETTGSS